jgi:hypothetical protein
MDRRRRPAVSVSLHPHLFHNYDYILTKTFYTGPAGNKAKGKAKTISTESKPPRKKARAQKKKKTGQQEESEEEQVDDDIYEDAETGEEDVC